jgi:hypothetical protein
MPKKLTPEQRQAALRMLAQGQDRDTIAAAVGVTPGQVSAISAHVKMGTYALPDPEEPLQEVIPVPEPAERTSNLLRMLHRLEGASGSGTRLSPILLGSHAESTDARRDPRHVGSGRHYAGRPQSPCS